MIRCTPRTILFPYTTLFRSRAWQGREGVMIGMRETWLLSLGVLGLACCAGTVSAQTEGPEITTTTFRKECRTAVPKRRRDRKSTRLNSSHANTSYAVFYLKK